MPFGMGRAGWYGWPYTAHCWGGWGPWYGMPYGQPFPSLSREEEETVLDEEIKAIESHLIQLKKRLEELKKKPSKKE